MAQTRVVASRCRVRARARARARARVRVRVRLDRADLLEYLDLLVAYILRV